MRSRNGNRPVLFAGIALISTLCIGADHYYIGYRLTTQNAQPVHETFSVSKAMQPCPASELSTLSLRRFPDESLKAVLEREKDTFIEYTLPDAIRIKSTARFLDSDAKTQETLTLPTQCYAVEFNDDSVTISVLK